MITAAEVLMIDPKNDNLGSKSSENVSGKIINECEKIEFDEKLKLSHSIEEKDDDDDGSDSCLTNENDEIISSSGHVKSSVKYQRIADESVVLTSDNYTRKDLPQQGAHFVRSPIYLNNKISIMSFFGKNRKQAKVTTSSNIRKGESIDHELRRIKIHEQLLMESRRELLLMGKLEMKTLIKEERRNITNQVGREGEEVRELVVGRGGNQKFTFAGEYKSKNSLAVMG